MISSSTRNVIFDLGGVIINLDFKKTYDAFANLGLLNTEELAFILNENKLFDKHGNGDLTDIAFRDEIRSLLKKEVTDENIDEAFNALLLDIPIERIKLLKKLAPRYRLFLLSNTNFIHIKKVNLILKNTCQVKDLSLLFEKIYYSYEIKLSKPGTDIYQKVLKENNLKPEETVFIDDNVENIEGAEKTGIKGILVNEHYTILEVFENEG